jgi:hypothetical protein
VIDKEFDELEDFSTKSIVQAVEKLIHKTKTNPAPEYKEVNQKLYKFPSYLRRATIAAAFGKMKSQRSNYKKWSEAKEQAFSAAYS